MKTSRTNRSNPNGKKIIPFVIAVAAFCFLNSQVIQARDHSSRYAPTHKVSILLTNQNQPGAIFQSRSWDFDFYNMFISFILRYKIHQAQVRAVKSQAPVREYNAGPVLSTETRRVAIRSYRGNDRRNEF
jgi:hypothetical protein